MRRSPYIIAQQLKETLCTYLETAYRISNQAIVEERANLLRDQAIVSQSPYVETTPLFEQTVLLRNLNLPHIPSQLNDLAEIGLPIGRRPLYRHQEESLRAAWDTLGEPRDLIVASGTGSGKTEIFYLTILADILREALSWETPASMPTDMGRWNRNEWEHRRRYEQRPAAVRAVILYPMNALVNDQLRRLRRTLASDAAIDWQLANLNENLIYFGRYTSQTMLPGTPDKKRKRENWDSYLSSIRTDWTALGNELQTLGYSPRPEGPEMLCRWNMQTAPPDILLTNYSMLEYMLVRPIEATIFSTTRDWLSQSPSHILTLVLDEAHTYSGTRGTEVAYLIRRLYERLGAGPEQIRCIATSASLGETPEDLERVRQFASNLFDHPEDRFSIVRASVVSSDDDDLESPSHYELQAFATFQTSLERAETEEDEASAVETLIEDLSLDSDADHYIERLYQALEHQPRIKALRDVTARNATELGEVARQVWLNLGTQEQQEQAVAGLLAAGAIARPAADTLSELPPLLPSRMHLMYKGLPGLWACLDPNCSVANQDQPRPCGKLYTEPRIWCDCGARVVELLSCRVCGLLVGGGIEESHANSRRIWPYEDDLESGIGQYDRYTIFALEDPGPASQGHKEWGQIVRNVRTTEIEAQPGSDTRIVWEPVRDDNPDRRPIQSPCPRCGQRPSAQGRNAIEPLRTTGAQAFSTLIEQAFRLQKPRPIPPQDESEMAETEDDVFKWLTPDEGTQITAYPPDHNPNLGRKALAFSDSRQNAARLAGDLMFLHYRDLFRQLMMDVLYDEESGSIPTSTLVDKLLNRAIERGIDPTFGELEIFWQQWDIDRTGTKRTAKLYLETYLRREIADRQVGVEALGLARWVIPGVDLDTKVPPIDPFDAEQTIALMYSTLRIVAGENVIIPSSLDPEDWPSELVEWFYRRVITLPSNPDRGSFVWEASRNNRLTRYLNAVLQAGDIPQSRQQPLMKQLWSHFRGGSIAVPVQGNRPGFGIPISRFALARMPKDVYLCRECKYISAETVNGVCLRCHQPSDIVPLIEAQNLQNNYYRKLSEFTFNADLPDPFPLRVLEHTAQISAEQAAKRERRFQDSFLPDEHVIQDGVDVLSVTTTMEMGIDVGDLTVVGLHNTPPTVANYQQRAGRAGRRSDGIAEVLTFSRHRSHDQYYYDRVADIVTGQVRIPTLHLNNHVIARRHVNALVLQRFFAEIHFGDDQTTLFEAFGTVGGLLDNNSQRLRQLHRFIENQSEFGIVPLLMGMLSGSGIAQYDVEGWLVELPDGVEEVCRLAAPEQLLLDLLIEKGLLPRYAFPVDVVALWINKPSRWNQGEEIQRDLAIALSEYAPGSEIIVDGKVYQSVGLYTPFEQAPNYESSGWYYECPYCHYVQFASRETNPERPGWETCTMCQTLVATSPQYRVMPAIEPKGFRTDWRRSEQRKYRGGGQERAGYASPAQLVAGENVEQGELCYDERLYVYHRTGDLFIVNRGPIGQEFPGFLICPQCGCHVDNPNQQHNNPDTGKPCRGGTQADRSVLLHHFNTDIVLFGVRLPFGYLANPAQSGGRAAWLSLGTALRQGAAAYLQIDPEELAMGIRPWYENDANRLSAEIYLYDTLPNGAGYAVEVAQEVNGILETATRIVSQCPTPCETACYRCLLEYGNQPYHGLLDRHLAYDLLGYVISGVVPQLLPATGAAALDRLRAFARSFSYEVGGDTVCPIYGILQSPDYNRSVILIPTHTFRPHMPEYEEHARSEGYHPVFVSHFDLIRRPFWVWDRLTPILEGHLDRIDLL